MGFFVKTNPIEKLKQEVERKPKDVRLLLELAGLFKEKNALAEAIEYYLRAAQANVELGFMNKGIAIAKQVVQFAPKATEPYEFLARCYEAQKLKEDLRGVLKALSGIHTSAGNMDEVKKLRAKIDALGPGR